VLFYYEPPAVFDCRLPSSTPPGSPLLSARCGFRSQATVFDPSGVTLAFGRCGFRLQGYRLGPPGRPCYPGFRPLRFSTAGYRLRPLQGHPCFRPLRFSTTRLPLGLSGSRLLSGLSARCGFRSQATVFALQDHPGQVLPRDGDVEVRLCYYFGFHDAYVPVPAFLDRAFVPVVQVSAH